MVVTTSTERLQSYRRSIVELLFAERNHVCAICVVNGYCELQNLGYAVGMDHVRFEYQTPALQIDASHKRFALDNNRCVLCQRCVRVCDEVEGAHTWDVKGRGASRPGHHRPRRALGPVAKLHELRQVRAGLPDRRALREDPAQGRDGQEPRLPRLPQDRAGEEAMDPVKAAPEAARKPRIATAWLGGCSGCHMSFLDMDERLIDLAPLIDLVYSPIMDVKEFPEDVDATLVEGAVANEENLHHLKLIRERTKFLVSFGDCAVTGNVTAMRNPLRRAEAVLKRAYIENVDLNPRRPADPGIVPVLLDRVRPVHEVVPVDVYLPGCPPSADLIHFVLTELVAGRIPDLKDRLKYG